MIIGLFDADMNNYIHVPFNLELMKLSSYYKKNNTIVSMSSSFSPNMYNKFIYRKDYYDGNFPKEILNDKRIIYGGRAFNKNNYIKLDEEVEKQKPDKYIYNIYKNKFCINKTMTEAFTTLMLAEHLRLSLDGKTIWNNFEKQINIVPKTNTLFFHDYNLNNIEDSDVLIKELVKKERGRDISLAVKFPILVDNSNDLLKWNCFQPSHNFFILQYEGLIEDEVLDTFIKTQYSTSVSSQLNYYITAGCESEEDFIKNRLQKVYRQIIYLRKKRRKVVLKYNDNFFSDIRWEQLIDLFNAFLKVTVNANKYYINRVIKYDSLYSFAFNLLENQKLKNRNYVFNKEIVRQLFLLVRENNYDCFKDFYECHLVELKGGKFEPC